MDLRVGRFHQLPRGRPSLTVADGFVVKAIPSAFGQKNTPD